MGTKGGIICQKGGIKGDFSKIRSVFLRLGFD